MSGCQCVSVSLCTALGEYVRACNSVPRSLLGPLSGLWTRPPPCAWVPFGALCGACARALPLSLFCSHAVGIFSSPFMVLHTSPSLCRHPQPCFSRFVSMSSHCPTSTLPLCLSLEENTQTPQRQHPKFILQQLWPRGKSKGGAVPKSGRHGVGAGFRAGLEPCTWQVRV